MPNPKTTTLSFPPQKSVSVCSAGDRGQKGWHWWPPSTIHPLILWPNLDCTHKSLYLRPRVSGETDSTPNQDESRSTEATYSGPISLIWVDLGIGLCAMLAHEQRRWLGRHLPMRLWGKVFLTDKESSQEKKQSSSKKLSHIYLWSLNCGSPSCNNKTKERHTLHLQPFPHWPYF